MNPKTQLANEKTNLEELLKQNDSIVWRCKGISMRPFIRGGEDLVVLEKIKNEPQPNDVVMYVRDNSEAFGNESNQKYVLHRLMYKEDNTYVILGDNCVTLEYVPKEKVIAIMTDIIRNGKKINIDNLWYKAYKQLWIKPWKLRVNIIKERNKIMHLLKKIKKK